MRNIIIACCSMIMMGVLAFFGAPLKQPGLCEQPSLRTQVVEIAQDFARMTYSPYMEYVGYPVNQQSIRTMTCDIHRMRKALDVQEELYRQLSAK